MRWWPYHRGHYLLNKKIDLLELFNEYDHNDSMDMIDSLIIADSVYDDEHRGNVQKKRAGLNKDYGRIGIAIDDERTSTSSGPQYLEPNEDGILPGLEGIPMMG